MSMTWDEVMYDEAMSDLYEENKKQAIQEFTVERLQSYYLEYPGIAMPALKALEKAQQLTASYPTASFFFNNIYRSRHKSYSTKTSCIWTYP